MTFLRRGDFKTEINERMSARERLLTFGVDFLDDAAAGILRNDLVLVGAHSGGGKTQFCCNIALANMRNGKRVHYLALEAEQWEIERRLKYQIFARLFYADQQRPKVQISFQDWMLGDLSITCAEYEAEATEEFERDFKNLFTFYKQDGFDLTKFIETVVYCSGESDLIIVDHVHYFDFDDENENRAIKEIAKTARTLCLEQGVPMVLVSHIRKRDRFNNDLVPSMEEFHGSSDLYKIATKAITMSPGAWSPGGQLETFFRVVKNRFEGSVTRVIASTNYSSKKGSYEKGYRLGDANQKRDSGFTDLERHLYPAWARNSQGESSGRDSHAHQNTKTLPNYATRAKAFSPGASHD